MKFVRQFALLALAVCSGLVVTGCEQKTTGVQTQPSLVSVAAAPKTATLNISGTLALTATGTFSDNSTLDLTSAATFSTDKPAVATVSGSGVVTAVNSQDATTPGVAHILVSAGGKSDTATITVSPPTVVAIMVAPKSASLSVGGSLTLSVSARYSQGSSAALTSGVTFAADHTDVATVDLTSGTVTGVAPGTATITATHTATGDTDTSVITVGPLAPPTLTSITAAPQSIPLTPTGTAQLTVTGHYSDGSSKTLANSGESFLSSNPAVATVSASGTVAGVGGGTASITVTDSASGLVANPSPQVTVTAPVATSNVYSKGALDTGVVFFDFGGANNSPEPAVDANTLFTDGTAALKVVVTGAAGAYSGGAWVANAPRDLRAFNALVFWAKGSKSQSTLKVQIGNDAGALANVNYQAESIGIPLTTSWQQFVVPMPDPTQANGIDGLFSFADGNNNYTFWLANVQYVNLPASVLGTGSVAGTGISQVPLAGNPPSLVVPVNGSYTISPGPNSIIWTLGNGTWNGSPVVALPNGGNLDNDAWRWFALKSSDTTVATVSADGVITGVKAGTANISGTLAGSSTNIGGPIPVTVTAPLATPTNNAATPGVAAANVIALFDSSGIYTAVPVDTWSTGWSSCCNTLVDPYAIPGGHAVKQYTLNSFVGVEFGLNGVNQPINATTMTTFHVDVWSPNPSSNLEIQLVNDAAGTAAIGKYEAGQIQANTWVSLEIPLSSFTGLTLQNKLNQLLFVAAGPQVLYIDNVYLHK